MTQETKWEQVPEVKLLKNRLDSAEATLEGVGDKIRHFRTQVALHYKLVWRVSLFTLTAILVLIPFVATYPGPNGKLWTPVWAIVAFLGFLPAVLLGIFGPADVGEWALTPSCKCEKCKPTKEMR